MNRLFRWFGLPGSLVLTVLISLLSVILAFIDPTEARLLCVPAMFLSSLGDILLMDYKPLTRHLPLRGFIPGAIAFLFSHLFYALAFFRMIMTQNHAYFNVGAWFGICTFLLMLIIFPIICKRKSGDRKMLVLCLAYLFFISLNCTTVYSAAFGCGGLRFLSAVGAFLFLLSDLFIGLDKTCGIRTGHNEDFIWTLYPLGQILLLIGA